MHGIAFIDSQNYAHQIHSLKNFLLVGDVFKSSYVLCYYQQDYLSCCAESFIPRDTNPAEVHADEFTIDE